VVVVWLPGNSRDRHTGFGSDVLLPGVRATRVSSIDTLNGFVQEPD
jgi:hypothetical protein